MPEKHIGKVVQVMGPVLDIRFADGELPELLNAIELQNNGKPLIVEVAQHIGDNVARCIGCPADGQRYRALYHAVHQRGSQPGHGGNRHRRADQGSRWRCVPWPCVQPAG